MEIDTGALVARIAAGMATVDDARQVVRLVARLRACEDALEAVHEALTQLMAAAPPRSPEGLRS